MHKKHLEHLLYSAGGVVALVVILIAANFIISSLNLRADLTQGSVYTLSPGTKAILSKLEAPVKIRFYYSQGGSALPVGLEDLRQARRGPARRIRARGQRQGHHREVQSGTRFGRRGIGHARRRRRPAHRYAGKILSRPVGRLPRPESGAAGAGARPRAAARIRHRARDHARGLGQQAGDRRDERAAGARPAAQPDEEAAADRAVDADDRAAEPVHGEEDRDERRQDPRRHQGAAGDPPARHFRDDGIRDRPVRAARRQADRLHGFVCLLRPAARHAEPARRQRRRPVDLLPACSSSGGSAWRWARSSPI